jgi:transcription initiation factor TFIID subunit 13
LPVPSTILAPYLTTAVSRPGRTVNALLYAHGDHKTPLPETARILDEILTDFIQGMAFEAARVAHHAGRQKLKFDDVEFALRKNPVFLGKVQEIFEKKTEIDRAKKLFHENPEEDLAGARDAAHGGGGAGAAAGAPATARNAASKAGSTAERSTASGRGRKRNRHEVDGLVGEEDLEDDLEEIRPSKR